MPTFPDFFEDAYNRAIAAGYKVRQLSRHDHWLSEEEFLAVPFLFYREARKNGQLPAFLELEARFLAFFDQLAEGGVRRVIGPEEDRPMNLRSARGRRFLQRGLREIGQLDLYFPRHKARFIAGFDMEFLVFLKDPAAVSFLDDAAARAGIFLLRPSAATD
ncbi:MAG: hypothetical protein K0R83_803 [Caulobacter sp.]|jgi:hypothetical protein|nr:hypothetical protein [Caulobacter sp.]